MDDSIEDYISKEMNIKLKKRKILIKDTDKEIMKTLKKEDYDIEYINFQNNSINGIANRSRDRYFFKILNKQDFINEIIGYIHIKETLPINRIKEILEFQNNYCIIIYNYENTISKNKGLLNDFFVKNDLVIYDDSEEIISKIINLYQKIFSKTIIAEEYPMQQFFKDRIDSRLKKWYNNETLFEYSVIINGVGSKKTKEIVKECIEFFNLNHKLKCALTQGDPNTLNIGIKPIFFDFATAGYNPIICELSAIFWSVIIADAYFCPKYHKKSYNNHENVFENIEKFAPDIKYTTNDIKKEINIVTNIKTSKIRIDFMKKYIKMLKELNVNINKEIIYFLIMRILCIFDIRTMEKKVNFYSIFILHYIYQNTLNDTYNSLNTILDDFQTII